MADIRPYLEKLGEDIKANIIEKLREEEPLTLTAISVRAKIRPQTARRRLRELVDEGRVVIREIERGTRLFFLSPELKKEDAK